MKCEKCRDTGLLEVGFMPGTNIVCDCGQSRKLTVFINHQKVGENLSEKLAWKMIGKSSFGSRYYVTNQYGECQADFTPF